MVHSTDLLRYTQNLNLLFVEDHQELRQSTTDVLKNFFKEVDAVCDGVEALELYKQKVYDIVLTDIRMPNIDGVTLTKKIYELNPSQSIIILSAHDESSYLIPLINLGVSQFIQKPIDYKELLETLYKVSKENKTNNKLSTPSIINFTEKSSYDRQNKMFIHENEIVSLTKYELIFLDLLTTQSGKIFSNEEIVEYYLQNNEKIDSQNIRKVVSKLRKKIPTDSIESIYGVGYRVIATI